VTSAASTAAWTQTYQYDGFGNLTAKVLNGSSTPIPVNAATNQLTNAGYDANGNMTSGAGATLTYDEANRISAATETSGGAAYYGYSPDNKRIYMNGGGWAEQWTFYGAKGEKLGVFGINNPNCSQGCGTQFTFAPEGMSVWFAGKLIQDSSAAGAQPVAQDRLGTNRVNGARFRPYGDEITSTSNDREKFGTYTRDSYTGFDYADQRFYASTYGRFNTPDPYMAAAKGANDPKTPGSWNRYAYVQGDPINANDPRGLYLMNGADESDLWGYGALGDGCAEMDPSTGYFFNCGVGGPISPVTVVSKPAPPPPAAPTCSISLDERPVPNVKGTPAYHTYLTVTDSDWANNGLLLEGGPTGNPALSSLYGFDTQAPGQGLGAGTSNASDPSLPSNKQIGSTYAGALACGAVSLLLNKIDTYDGGSLATYNFLAIPGTYNSNSFTSTLLYDLSSPYYRGILNAFGSSVPGIVPGWGKLVPGL
jgi:RHS repeat-associated protein